MKWCSNGFGFISSGVITFILSSVRCMLEAGIINGCLRVWRAFDVGFGLLRSRGGRGIGFSSIECVSWTFSFDSLMLSGLREKSVVSSLRVEILFVLFDKLHLFRPANYCF